LQVWKIDSIRWPDRREMRAGSGFVSAFGANDRCLELSRGLFELAAGVAFVADDGDGPVAVEAGEQCEADLALRRLW
jgi:hypothetical protein